MSVSYENLLLKIDRAYHVHPRLDLYSNFVMQSICLLCFATFEIAGSVRIREDAYRDVIDCMFTLNQTLSTAALRHSIGS